MNWRQAAALSRRKTDPEVRFWRKVRLSPGCWEWTGGCTFGYGRFYDGERVVLATRWIWQRIYGPLAEGVEVAHSCDNPPCVRPSHLFAATHAENVADMHRKSRGSPPPVHRGERHHSAKLSDTQVAEIRARYSGQYGEKAELSREYGVSQITVGRLLRGTFR